MDNILKIKAVLLYILQHSERDRHNVYSIVKTAYYAQQLHFVKWALPLYKDKIAALQFGPVPSTIYDVLKMARGDKRVLTYYGDSPLRSIADSIGFQDELFMRRKKLIVMSCLNQIFSVSMKQLKKLRRWTLMQLLRIRMEKSGIA